MVTPEPEVTLYSVEGCHLCDCARTVIIETANLHPFKFTEILLEDCDPRLSSYRAFFPVICVNGLEIGYWRK